MGNKSEELDYIADIMKAKKDEKKVKQKRKSILNNDKISVVDINKSYYKIGPKKIHKNITLDEELVKWINKEAKDFNLNFSETINQILKFSFENSKKK